MRRFSESIAEALKGKIRVVSIHPAFVATDMARRASLSMSCPTFW